MSQRSAVRRRIGLAGLATALLFGGVAAGGTAGATPDPGSGHQTTESTAARLAGDARGVWTVTTEGPGSHRLTWRSPAPLPVTDAAPEFWLDGELLPRPSLAADGRTLTLLVGADQAPRVDQLQVRLSGRVLDSTAQPSARGAATAYQAPDPGRPLDVDPGEPGPYGASEATSYELAGLPFPGYRSPIEMEGQVVLPTGLPEGAEAPPLVLFLHGRHATCYDGRAVDMAWPCESDLQPIPSERGYTYVQQLLATQGYASVSIAANGINAQDWKSPDGGAEARGLLVQAHLDHWAEQVAAGEYDVDLQRVVLVGHSRGGEGVNQASMTIPLSAPYRVVGQVLIAPTAFARAVASYVPTVTLLPYCDGDVIDLQGQAYTDRARDVVGDDTALHSSVLVMGANHNYFNTEWTKGISAAPSDDDGAWSGKMCRKGTEMRLTAKEQRAVGQAWIAGAARLMAGGEDELLPMFDGSDVEVASAGDADVRSHAVGLGRDLRRPGFEASIDPADISNPGMVSELCQGRIGRKAAFCGQGASSVAAPHWVDSGPWTKGMPTAPAWHLAWQNQGPYAWMGLGAGGWDVSGAEALALRTVVANETGPLTVRAILRDGSGEEAAVEFENAGQLAPFPGRNPLGKLWAQELRLPLTDVGDVDLTDLRRIALQGMSQDGELWVLEVAAVTDGVPALQDRRLPLVVAEDTKVQEGDGGPTTAALSYRVLGELTRDALLNVRISDESDWENPGELRQVTIPAGQTEGTIEVEYDADTRDDVRRRPISMTLFGVHDAMPGRSKPVLTILDDDPDPKATVRAARTRIVEGQRATWRLRLSAPVDYYVSSNAKLVASSSPLTVGDLPRRWVKKYLYEVPPPGTPLHKAGLWLPMDVQGTRGSVSIPVRADGVKEGPETVSLRIRVRGPNGKLIEPTTVTVTVRDR
ncbi:hypothetical protein [Nocardioides ferulae]|uniref:hypothetical protein n=1 Tax=Nocardioides ferulae TaxID=2340821 RepID=UPI000F868C79|nr:hypothetical protein [Nocardioides ferulae]